MLAAAVGLAGTAPRLRPVSALKAKMALKDANAAYGAGLQEGH